MNLLRNLAVVFVVMASTSIAHAVPIIVNSEADFLSLVGDVTREGFESFPTDTVCGNGGSAPATSLNTANFSVTTNPQDGGTSFLCIGDTGGGPHPTEGVNALIAGSNTGDSWILEFLLDEAVTGVYFELSDAAESGDAFILIDGFDPILIAGAGSPDNSIILFGIVFDEAFSSFSLLNTGPSDGWGVDNMIFATVPEPGTLALFGIGLAGMGLTRRRKIRSNVAA